MKKTFLFGVLTLVMACLFVVSGCGNQGNVTLKTMSMFGGTDPHAPVYEQLIADFEEQYKVSVKDNSAVSDEIWKTSVLSSYYTGSEPDVLYFFNGATAKPLVDNGYVVSVADIRKEYSDYASNISASVMDPYCVTISGFVEGLFVNKSLFTGDLAPYLDKDSWTWDEFLEIGTKLNAKNITPVALGATDVPHYWIEHLVLNSVGTQAFTNIPAAADFTSTPAGDALKWVNALKLFNTLADANMFGTTKGSQAHTAAETSFKTGKAAMILDGSWFANGFNATSTPSANDLIMMPFPSIPTSLGGQNEHYMQSGFTSGYYISKSAWEDPARRELAVNFVKHMTSTDAIKKMCAGGGVPADTSVVIEGLNPLQLSMNTMPGRTTGAVLPLSDACKAGTFATLVSGANDYLTANTAEIIKVLNKFASEQ